MPHEFHILGIFTSKDHPVEVAGENSGSSGGPQQKGAQTPDKVPTRCSEVHENAYVLLSQRWWLLDDYERSPKGMAGVSEKVQRLQRSKKI